MLKLTLNSLRSRKRRLVGTFIAIFLGVAFLSGTLVLGDTLTANFDRLFADANANTDVVVRSANDIPAEDLQSGRGLIPATLVDQVGAVGGVKSAEPSIQGYGQLIDRNGKAVGGNGPPTLAGNWIANPTLNPYRLAEGRAPVSDEEIVLNRGAAKTAGFSIGDVVTVRTPAPVQARIVGLSTFGSAAGMGAVTFTAFTFEAAQRLLTSGSGQVSSVLVQGDGTTTQDELAARIQSVLPDGVEAITGDELTRENLSDIAADFLGFFKTFLLVFSGIALLVATFSIYNTFSILVAQRTRESALLRALGASRRQILTSVLAETGVVGLFASTAGALGGLGIAGLLKGLFDAFGFSLPAGGLTVDPAAVVIAIVIGLAVTLVSGLAPAVRASRIAPLAALREAAIDRIGASRLRAVIGTAVTGLGAALVVVALLGDGSAAMLPAGLGAMATLVGVVVVGPVVARPASAVIGSPLSRLLGVTGVLARRNAMRNPRRTSGTAAALMVGVSVVTLFTVFAASLRASVDERVTESVTADLVIGGGQFGGGGLSPELANEIAALPEVDEAVGLGTGVAIVDSRSGQLTIADPAALSRLLDLDVREGSLEAMAAADLAVSRAVAEDHGWTVGTQVPVRFLDGATSTFTVAALYDRADVAGNYVLSRQAWAPHAIQDIDTLVLIGGAGDDLTASKAAVEQVAARYGNPSVLTRSEYIEDTTSFLRTALGIVYVMLALAILIALMGIANTLSLSIHERRRELGLLRAVGETRSQVRSMVRWESVIIATFGTAGGLGLGLFLAWSLVQAASGADFMNTFAAPAGQLVVVLIVGALAGVLAGMRPARRAARLDVLSAIAS